MKLTQNTSTVYKKAAEKISSFYEYCLQNAEIIIILINIISITFTTIYISHCDLIEFDYIWAQWIKNNDFLSIYHMENGKVLSGINYPPLYPFFLYLFGGLINNPHSHLAQLGLKGFPILMYLIGQIYLYKAVSKDAALRFTLCTPLLFNALVWGQRDSVFALFLFFIFRSIEKHKVYSVSIWFAFLCLLKPQGVYILPVLLLYLIAEKESTIKDKILSLIMGGVVGIGAFVPFMIKEHSVLTIFTPYLYAGSNMHTVNSYAPNIWFPLMLEPVTDNLKYVPIVVTMGVILVLVIVYRQKKDIVLATFVYLLLNFIFNLYQCERYALYPFIVLFYMCFISINKDKYKQYLKSYYIYAFVCFAIQLIVWLKQNSYYDDVILYSQDYCYIYMTENEINTLFYQRLQTNNFVSILYFSAKVVTIISVPIMLDIIISTIKNIGWIKINNKKIKIGGK